MGEIDEKPTDVSHIEFSSTGFPTKADMELWRSLSPREQHAVIMRDEEAGFQSGLAAKETLDDRLARVRADRVHAL